jgi:hypothetical protein
VVKLNGHDARLQLDTGAGGITLGRKVAEKAGLKSIAEERYYGIGDKGAQADIRPLQTIFASVTWNFRTAWYT